ncbi:MAG: methyltransferase domain-containing protein [bacterium]
MDQARAAAAQGCMDEVVASLRLAVNAAPFHAEANAHLAWIDSQNGRYAEALASYGRLVLRRPWSAQAWIRALQCLWLHARRVFNQYLAPLPLFSCLQKAMWMLLDGASRAAAGILERGQHRNPFISLWMRHHRTVRRLVPVNPYEYYKLAEIDFALHHLPEKGRVCVDMGCGRSAFPSFLAARGYTVAAVELHRESLTVQHQLRGKTTEDKLHPLAADFLHMPLLESSVDAVTLISTIEHVPGDGDRLTVERLARILKPGGRLIITVPAAAHAREEWIAGNIGHVYTEARTHADALGYLRVYDPAAVQARLIHPSGLALVRLTYYGERTQWGWLGLGRNFIDHRGGVHPSRFAAPLYLLFGRELWESELATAPWSIACICLEKPHES